MIAGRQQGQVLRGAFQALRRLVALVIAVICLGVAAYPAHALKSIVVDPELDRLEITTLGDLYEGRGDSIQLETAPGADGATGRMSVNAVTAGTNPNWIVFALTNPTDRAIERWMTADRYSVVGSGIVWPDLDSRRIEALTPSIGFVPERIPNERADIFRVTLEPGQTITFVAELKSDRFARLHLWKPIEYELKVRDRQLFNGVMLGLTALLAIFLTAIFAANHKLIFPAGALVAWCVLGVLFVDFGFFHKLFQLKAEDNAIYRAATESALAASLVIFLHVFLRLGLWHGLMRMLIGTWMLGQLVLVAVAVVDPRLAATFARVSFGLIGMVGACLTLFLALRGQDRALALVPTWLLFCVWVFGAGLVLVGRLPGDIAVSALVSGLVLILLLIGFTVTQFAFRSIDPLYGAAPSELQLRSMAIDGAGAGVWEWSARRDEMKISSSVEMKLGLNAGELSAKTDDFLKHLHPTDRDRFRLLLQSIQEKSGSKLKAELRLRHADNSYRWFEFEAASIASSDGRTPKCVGLIRDVTESKRSHERLVHDAVHCSLTGLPNRELFLDRLGVAVDRAKSDNGIRPALFLIDIDKFKSVNNSFGLVVGDTLLLTAARRLQRHTGPQDTLARIGGDQFALLFPTEQTAEDLAALAERIRRSLRSPVKIANQEIVLTGSVGIAIWDGKSENRHDLLKEAEIAMYRAKRGGADRIEIFRPEMRGERDDRVAIESELRKALEKNQLRVLYQPIIYLPTEELAGFEALVRWEHPKHGMLNPASFVPVAEESDLIIKLGSHVLARAAQDAAQWQRILVRPERPLFVSVNVSSRQLFRPELNQEIRHVLGQNLVPKGSLHLEVTESLVMENPEQAVEMLEWLRSAGADLSLDDFGTGYSSLAYLHRLPCDTIKIDKSLLRARGSTEGSGAVIVRSIVALAHELEKKVIAEGVETPEDVSFLRAIGCEFAQGFYYGEAIPERDVNQLLKMVVKSERKLQPRGFFKSKRKKVDDEAAPAPAMDGEAVAAAKAANGHGASAPGVAKQAAANGMRKRPRPTGNPAVAADQRQMRPAGPPPPIPGNASGPVASAAAGPPPLPPMSQVQPPSMTDAAMAATAAEADPQPFASAHVVPSLVETVAHASPPPLRTDAAASMPPASPSPAVEQPAAAVASSNPSQPAASSAPSVMHDVSVVAAGYQPGPPQPPRPAQTYGHGRAAAAVPPIDLSRLPPGIAASLARLAGAQSVPMPNAAPVAPAGASPTPSPAPAAAAPPADAQQR